jgi:hypothetical protein
MMKIETIVKTLEYPDEGVPREALEAAIARREEITPHLLSILEQAVSDFDRVVDDQSYTGHLYALYLLAQFREERAYPLIVEFFSIPGEAPLEVTGDFVTEGRRRVKRPLWRGYARIGIIILSIIQSARRNDGPDSMPHRLLGQRKKLGATIPAPAAVEKSTSTAVGSSAEQACMLSRRIR